MGGNGNTVYELIIQGFGVGRLLQMIDLEESFSGFSAGTDLCRIVHHCRFPAHVRV